jgi:hypothetical protein
VVARVQCDEGVRTNRGGCMEGRGRARRISASDGVQKVVLEQVGGGAFEWGWGTCFLSVVRDGAWDEGVQYTVVC